MQAGMTSPISANSSVCVVQSVLRVAVFVHRFPVEISISVKFETPPLFKALTQLPHLHMLPAEHATPEHRLLPVRVDGAGTRAGLVYFVKSLPSQSHCVPSGSVYTWPAAALLQSTHEPSDRKSTRLNSSHSQISYAVFCF